MSGLKRYINDREREYYRRREEAVSAARGADLLDLPFLLTSRQVVTEAITRYELFRKIIGVAGAIVECGVHRGNNLLFFSHLSSILEPYAIARRIYGFDTFAGFGRLDDRDPQDVKETDFSDTSAALIEEAIALFDLNRAAGHMPKTSIIKGDAAQTIPAFVAEHSELTVALLYLDFDLHAPTKVALEQFLPLVPRGGIVAFDEFNYDRFPGPTQALKDVLPVRGAALTRLPFDPFVSYFVVE